MLGPGSVLRFWIGQELGAQIAKDKRSWGKLILRAGLKAEGA